MKRTTFAPLLVGLALALALPNSEAQPTRNPPGQISYQGFLTDANGLPLATNTPRNYTIVFRIWDASTGGNVLWAEQQIVTVDRGYFTVMLGVGSSYPGAPFTNNLSGLFSGSSASDRYIGITATDLSANEIAPRLRLLASPYSFLASTALSVDASGSVPDSTLSSNVALRAGGNNFTGVQTVASGKVGIGTISPSRALEVHDSGDSEIGIQSTESGSHLWTLQSSSTTNLANPQINASFQIIDRTANAARFLIDTSGNVGIGTDNPGAMLQVNGVIQGAGFGPPGGHTFNFTWDGSRLHAIVDLIHDVGIVSLSSDRRLKEDIQPLANDALNRVMALKPSLFKYKEIPGSIFHGDGQVNEGFIADELQQVIPSAVNGDKDALTKDGQIQPQTLNIMPVVSVLTKAMQEQQQTIQQQQRAIQEEERAIQGLNQKLERCLEQKETEITELKARLEKLAKLPEHNSNVATR